MCTSTIEFCPAIREYVDVDQTQVECAVDHGCIMEGKYCPLGLCFYESRHISPFFLQPYNRHYLFRHH